MGYSTNFDDEIFLDLDTGKLTVGGSTFVDDGDLLDGAELLSRTVTIEQGGQAVTGDVATGMLKWNGTLPLGGATFAEDQCEASGTESYAIQGSGAGAAVTNVTVKWLQTSAIKKV